MLCIEKTFPLRLPYFILGTYILFVQNLYVFKLVGLFYNYYFSFDRPCVIADNISLANCGVAAQKNERFIKSNDFDDDDDDD